MGKRKHPTAPDLASSTPTVALIDNVQHFEASAKFKLSNIRPYFEGPASSVAEKVNTPSFGPGHLSIRAKEKSIAVYFFPVWGPETQFPITLEISLIATASPSTNCVHYNKRCTTKRTWRSRGQDKAGHGWDNLVSLQDWRLHKSFRAANILYLDVTVRSSPQLPSPRSPPTLNVLHRTIRAAHSPTCRFTVFDRQTPTGKLSNRRVLSVDRDVIRTQCCALEDMLSGKSHWDGIQIQLPSDEDPATSVSYPDSDLEGDPDDHDQDDASSSNDGDSDPPDNSDEDSSSEESDDDTNNNDSDDDSSRDDSADDSSNSDIGTPKIKHISPPPKNEATEKPIKAQGDPPQVSQEDKTVIEDEKSNLVHEGEEPMQVDLEVPLIRVEGGEDKPQATEVVVVGAASVTWEALVFYLHTGIIAFAPLSSAGRGKRATYIEAALTDDRPRLCSPKSMYRLADKMQLYPLKQPCLNEIRDQLNVRNILAELLSIFTSDYDEVKEMELEFLVQHSSDIMGSTALSRIMVEVAKGSYPHAGALLAEAWRRVGGASFKPQ